MPAVPLIACGGSIESRIDGRGVKELTGDFDALVAAAEAAAGVEAAVRRFARQVSFSFDAGDLVSLARLVREQPAGERVVVTFGTDLLEEVAFALDVVGVEAGVVVTGAAADASLAADGLTNLVGALRAARADELPRGCAYLAFGGSLWLGRDAVETHAGPDSFRGSARGPVARWDDVDLRLDAPERCRPLPSVPLPAAPRPVLLVASQVAFDSGPLDVERAAVVVAHGFGSGNVPPALAAALEARLERGAPVILCSAGPGLAVRGVSREPGAGLRLLERGALSAGRLTARKACLLAALCFGDGARDGRRAFSDVVAALG